MQSAIEGGCSCRQVRYWLKAAPMIVHCCHCRWCQRETGSAFAINAVIESNRLDVTAGTPIIVATPSASGRGQEIARCPACKVALWSHYASSGRRSSFIRVGTMDFPDACPPGVHIFTSSKQDWVVLPGDVPAFAEFYPSRKGVWSEVALMRWGAMLAGA